jgi:hypothetical protein
MLPVEETANPAISAVSLRRDPLTQSAPDNSAGSNSEFGPRYDGASVAVTIAAFSIAQRQL